MPFSTRLILVVYDTPGSVAWVHRLDNWSGVGRPGPTGAGAGGGGGFCGSGAPTAASCTVRPDGSCGAMAAAPGCTADDGKRRHADDDGFHGSPFDSPGT